MRVPLGEQFSISEHNPGSATIPGHHEVAPLLRRRGLEPDTGQRRVPGQQLRRAVTGTARKDPNQSERREQCSSVQNYTFTPATTTSTVYETMTLVTEFMTETATITIAVGTTTIILDAPNKRAEEHIADLERRQTIVTPTAVPAYAMLVLTSPSTARRAPAGASTPRQSRSPTAYYTSTITVTATSTNTETKTLDIPAATETACGPGLTLCSGRCKNLKQDGNNCGACGKVCPGGGGCGNSYCTNPKCTVPSTCDARACTGSANGCYCVKGVEGNFCSNAYYASCDESPKCTTSADCPFDGVCILAGSQCCAFNVCFMVSRGLACDNAASPSRLFRRGGRGVEKGVVAEGMLEVREDGKVWPLQLDG